MSEIKFRQRVNGEFYYWGIGIANRQGDKIPFVGPMSGNGIRVDSTPQEQYTGLKDANGVEIYEGDIVESEVFFPSKVLFNKSEACFAFGDWSVCDYFDYYVGESPEDDTRYSVKVIGNIHDNPELLEEV